MKLNFDFFPDWKTKALTFSYDDGALADVALEKIFSQHGLKCTYNIPSSFTESDKAYVDFAYLKSLQGQEIACHTKTHPLMTNWSDSMILSEFAEDKKTLESRLNLLVQGAAYPYGWYTPKIKEILRMLGLEYARTTVSTSRFSLPTDFLEWNPTCHHHAAENYIEPFLAAGKDLRLFYIWGHSFEFEREKNWDLIERIADRLSGRPDVWYATNGEICEYMRAVRNLKCNADGGVFYNGSCVDVYAEIDSRQIILHPGYNRITDCNDKK